MGNSRKLGRRVRPATGPKCSFQLAKTVEIERLGRQERYLSLMYLVMPAFYDMYRYDRVCRHNLGWAGGLRRAPQLEAGQSRYCIAGHTPLLRRTERPPCFLSPPRARAVGKENREVAPYAAITVCDPQCNTGSAPPRAEELGGDPLPTRDCDGKPYRTGTCHRKLA